MAEFIRETDPPARFTVPDRPTVYQQLEFFSIFNAVSREPLQYIRTWNASKSMIEEWECKLFPDFKGDLAEVDDPNITSIVMWASARVMRHMNGLTDTDPN